MCVTTKYQIGDRHTHGQTADSRQQTADSRQQTADSRQHTKTVNHLMVMYGGINAQCSAMK